MLNLHVEVAFLLNLKISHNGRKRLHNKRYVERSWDPGREIASARIHVERATYWQNEMLWHFEGYHTNFLSTAYQLHCVYVHV